MNRKEGWLPVISYEGLYEVSNFGRVKSLRKIIDKGKYGVVTFPEIIMKQNLRGKNNYLVVGLHKNKKTKTMSVHRLVAEAFIPNINNHPQVKHKDFNKTNNNSANLEWGTAQEVIINALNSNLLTIPNGTKNGQSKLKDADVFDIRNSRKQKTRKELSETYNVSIKHIDRVRGKERWKHI